MARLGAGKGLAMSGIWAVRPPQVVLAAPAANGSKVALCQISAIRGSEPSAVRLVRLAAEAGTAAINEIFAVPASVN